ncbi:dienelactone hydrolase family protein [Chitinophaga sp. sic0106]|uniref:dienelactone hydrolase family protein n=1 Tax=Chitinophaga sp. sic0106 TaxID=2854785 RepID=UPI001C472C06|nr:dienelactone hydrolase family protein [Chitinophaga sp. sic0106]MBV7531381.1 dienelactone hydrolase family protein [Chitinophaga sp. sic0106]
MKKLLLAITLFTVAGNVQAQTASCCHSDAITDFAGLANSGNFVMQHANPLPYTYAGVEGQGVTFPATDGKDAAGFLFKAKSASNLYLFVYQEWWGLNDYIKKESEKLYNDLGGKVNVLALDMYDGKTATEAAEAGKLMQATPRARLQAIMEGALKYAGPGAKIATLGWCFGGGLSLQSGLINGKQNIGDVMYYGMPEKDVEKLKTLHAPVLGFFANKDKGINPQVVAEFKKNMAAAGKSLTVYTYDADHGFANPSNPIYDSNATREAYAHAIAFLKKQFGVK